MRSIRLDKRTKIALSEHRLRMNKLNVPLDEPRFKSFFKQAMQGEITSFQWFVITKILQEDSKFGKQQDDAAATLGASPEDPLRLEFNAVEDILNILRETKEQKTEGVGVKDFYKTVGVMVLEHPHISDIERYYLGPEFDRMNRELSTLRDCETGYKTKGSMDILDVGFGKGRYLIPLSALENVNIVGIDYSLLMQLLTLRIAQLNSLRVDAREGDATNLKFPNNNFDVTICMYSTLGNIPDYKKALQEMARVTRDYIYLSVYSEESVDSKLEVYESMGLEVESASKGVIITKEGLISKQYSKDSLSKIIRDSIGLTPHIEEIGSLPMGYLAIIPLR